MLSRLGRRHLFEKVFANDEADRSKESNGSFPDCIRANASVVIDNADLLFAIFVFLVGVRANRAKDDD